MGGSSSSPRVVTVEKDEGNVVTISEDVARRLLGKPDNIVSHQQAFADDIPKRRTTLQAESVGDDVKMLEGHYRRRIISLENRNAILQQSNDNEFASTLKEFEAKFQKHTIGNPVCSDLQQAVERCYADNPGSSLVCLGKVKAFKECVQHHRQAMFATKG